MAAAPKPPPNAPGEPKEGAEPKAPPVAPNSGALVAPNADVLAAPNAGVLAAPNAGVLLPPNGDEAPKAGVLGAPNAGDEDAPKALVPNAGCEAAPNKLGVDAAPKPPNPVAGLAPNALPPPNAGVAVEPNAGVEPAPNAGVDAAPNAGVLAAEPKGDEPCPNPPAVWPKGDAGVLPKGEDAAWLWPNPLPNENAMVPRSSELTQVRCCYNVLL